METLKLLCDYFPTAIYTGKCLVFVSEDYRVELTEHKESDFSQWEYRFAKDRQDKHEPRSQPSVIRVRIYKKALSGELVMGHYEDFQLPTLGELAEQIEKYVQSAIGKNIRENIE